VKKGGIPREDVPGVLIAGAIIVAIAMLLSWNDNRPTTPSKEWDQKAERYLETYGRRCP